MKLDNLRVLELEVFTCFGVKLEKSIERQIQRGRVLREILKQDQRSPLAIEFQMAWLVAFNNGLFDGIRLEEIERVLEYLGQWVAASTLKLSSPREDWVETVKR